MTVTPPLHCFCVTDLSTESIKQPGNWKSFLKRSSISGWKKDPWFESRYNKQVHKMLGRKVTPMACLAILVSSVVLMFCVAESSAVKLCERFYFNHGDEKEVPYVQFTGVYRKFQDNNGHPIFKHEERNYYFEYVNSKGENAMAFTFASSTNSSRSYVGLHAKMTSDFVDKSWQNLITSVQRPYRRFIRQWQYYDWQSAAHTSVSAGTIGLICVPRDVFRCTTGRVFFNTTFTSSDNGAVLHNHLTDYFEELVGGYYDYRNNRKRYRHSRQTKWILSYSSPYWYVAQEGYTSFLRAKDGAFRPEYITSDWETLVGSTWRRFTNPVGVFCRGLLQRVINGTSPSCTEWNPCQNGGTCTKINLTNETVCICREGYRGDTCSKVYSQCPIYIYPSSVRQVVMYNKEASSFASVFCKRGRPTFFISQCEEGSSSTTWTRPTACTNLPPSTRATPSTRAPVTVKTVPRWNRPKEQTKPFSFDDHYWTKPVLLAVVPLIQVLIPTVHMFVGIMKDKSALRIISLHAFFTYLFWLCYLFGCRASQCHKYGEVMQDFTIMGIVMVLLGYVYMLIESCCSPENEYIASISLDVSVVDYINKLRSTDPVRTMKIECYHMELRTRTVYYTDAQGNSQSRIETYQEMVTTYTESKNFPIGRSVDISDLDGLRFDQGGVTRLKLEKMVTCGDSETQDKFWKMQKELIEQNKHRDEKICFDYNDVIAGFEKRMCAYTDTKHKSFWMNLTTFWIVNFLGLTWLYRALFHLRTKKLEYTIQKKIFLGQAEVADESNGPQIVYRPDGVDYVDHYGNHGAGVAAAPSQLGDGGRQSIEMSGFPNEPPPCYFEVVSTEARLPNNSAF